MFNKYNINEFFNHETIIKIITNKICLFLINANIKIQVRLLKNLFKFIMKY
jgi:hypothetical protein